MDEPTGWVTLLDERLLETIRGTAGVSVGELAAADGIEASRSRIARRCETLAEHGLLSSSPDDGYTLADPGQRYLDEPRPSLGDPDVPSAVEEMQETDSPQQTDGPDEPG